MTLKDTSCSWRNNRKFTGSFITVFFNVFSFHRVSKRCRKILSNCQVRTHVDFWQVQHLTRNQRKQVKGICKQELKHMYMYRYHYWGFPMNKNPILAFLQRYSGGCLKSINLWAVSEEILIYLNLETICLHSSACDPPNAFARFSTVIPTQKLYIVPRIHEILPLPKTLKVFSI